MNKELLKDIEDYWTERSAGYSRVNQDELLGVQKQNWLNLLDKQILAAWPHRRRSDISVLDVGTGPGFFAVILAEAGYRVTAVDYTAAMLEQARVNAGGLADKIDFLQMNGMQLDFPTESFDVVVSRNLTWNLEQPEKAYRSWCTVLKTGGCLLNFDANWYSYLYDAEEKEKYEADRANVEAQGLDDHYNCTDIEAMERIARQVPLSGIVRPQWDERVLMSMGMNVECMVDMGRQVWSEIEQINYAATPLFMVKAVK